MTGRINWYRSPLDKGRMMQLTKRSNLQGLLQAGSFLLIYLCTASLCFYFFKQRQWGLMAAACYLHATFHAFVGMEAAVHELSHGTPFKTKWLNEFFYRLFCFLTWNNYLHFRVSHMKHHQYTVHKGLDKEVILAPIDLTATDFLSWFTFDFKKFKMLMFPNIAHCFGRADVDFFFWDPLFPPGDKQRATLCNWARIMVVGHLLLLGLFIYFKAWVLIFVVNFGGFFATYLAKGCGMQQHLGLHPNVPDWRISCHTMKFNPLVGYLYWQMQYHIEHHMYAAVPFFNLHKLHKALASDMPEPPGSFFAGIRRILRLRQRQREDPAYCFTPEFPPTATPPKLTAAPKFPS